MAIRLSGGEVGRSAVAAAHRFGSEQHLSGDESARIAIVIEEIITNLYEHGGVAEQDVVDLALRRDDRVVTIIIGDPGTPFDPRAAELPDEPPERGGGAGIKLVKAWAEIVDYQSTAGRNRIELRILLAEAR